MAIPCETCGKPVHEQVVVCPHCGGETGVPSDPVAEVEIATLRELPPAAPPVIGAPSIDLDLDGLDPLAAVVAGGVALVLELIGKTDAEPEPLPRAIAYRVAPERPHEPDTREPEPTPSPSAQPRILK